jgi:hypothetical protein
MAMLEADGNFYKRTSCHGVGTLASLTVPTNRGSLLHRNETLPSSSFHYEWTAQSFKACQLNSLLSVKLKQIRLPSCKRVWKLDVCLSEHSIWILE